MSSGKVTVTRGGETFEGYFVVADGMVKLLTNFAPQKATQVGHSSPEKIAEMMLRELVQVRQARIAAGP